MQLNKFNFYNMLSSRVFDSIYSYRKLIGGGTETACRPIHTVHSPKGVRDTYPISHLHAPAGIFIFIRYFTFSTWQWSCPWWCSPASPHHCHGTTGPSSTLEGRMPEIDHNYGNIVSHLKKKYHFVNHICTKIIFDSYFQGNVILAPLHCI